MSVKRHLFLSSDFSVLIVARNLFFIYQLPPQFNYFARALLAYALSRLSSHGKAPLQLRLSERCPECSKCFAFQYTDTAVTCITQAEYGTLRHLLERQRNHRSGGKFFNQ